MSKILRRRTAEGHVQRLLEPDNTVTFILRRRAAGGHVRRILGSGMGSAVAVSVVTPTALESLAGLIVNNSTLLEWLTPVPAPVRVSRERLLASPGKRRVLSTPGRLRLLKRL